METTVDLTADIIDVRDIIERVKQLRTYAPDPNDVYEHMTLRSILADLVGYGGDEKWEGDWYPVTLVRDSYFTTYARELLEDCGTIPRDLPSWVEIDWDATARNVRMDYTAIEIDGTTYWYR